MPYIILVGSFLPMTKSVNRSCVVVVGRPHSCPPYFPYLDLSLMSFLRFRSLCLFILALRFLRVLLMTRSSVAAAAAAAAAAASGRRRVVVAVVEVAATGAITPTIRSPQPLVLKTPSLTSSSAAAPIWRGMLPPSAAGDPQPGEEDAGR